MVRKPRMYGWNGKILGIDLSARTHRVIEPDEEILCRCIGGRGLAGRYLRDFMSLEYDHPDMPVIFMTGPLTGTIAPTSGRMTVMSRSPLTETCFDASVGGAFGTRLKRAGWDGMILTGRAEGLTGLEIRGSEVVFHDAKNLAGADALSVMEQCRAMGSVAAVGPAAERGVRFASIMVDSHHAAGRGGLGLCLAAKNIKFITAAGSGRISIADKAGLKAAREDIVRLTSASPALLGEFGFSCWGTGALYDLISGRRMMPTDNFRATHFRDAPMLNASAFRKRYTPRSAGCKGCHILCKKVSSDGTPMPEFETMSHFTALIRNSDMDTVVGANMICNRCGMDTITAASTLACRTEITGDVLTPERMLSLLEDMGNARGDGAELAAGSLVYAAGCGRSEASMSVKGLELPAYDPRGAYGMALAYAVSTRGGCHLRAYPVSHEVLGKPVLTDRFSFSGKARIIKISEDAGAMVDSLSACKFIFFAAGMEEYAKALTAATGEEFTAHGLLAAGERVVGAERAMNAEAGFTDADDDLPPRFFTEGGSDGAGITVPPIDREAFLKSRAAYYSIRGPAIRGSAVRGSDERGVPRAEAESGPEGACEPR